MNARVATLGLMATAVVWWSTLDASQRQPPIFQSGVDVVRLDVSVLNRHGAPVLGLTGRDFLVTDNGARQDVQSIVVDQLPLSVQLVLDVSASVSGRRLARLIAAARELLTALRPGDRAGLITFSHVVRVRMGMTDDLAAVGSALGALAGDGRTALHDAIQLAIATGDEVDARRLVLVFTDGIDNASWLTEEAVLDSARRGGMVIHIIRVGADASSSSLVEHITEAAGGRVWSAASESDLERLFTRALDEMRARYLLTFSPAHPVRPGWHELKVRLKNGGGDVTARRGYFVVPR